MAYMKWLGVAAAALLGAAGAFAGEYTAEPLFPGSGMHGIHGIAFDAADRMFVGSVVGQTIFEIDMETGAPRTYIEAPLGMADDLEFGPDGALFWTAFSEGAVYSQKDMGPTRTIATGLLGINSIAFNDEGRLFAAQVFLGDTLWELDPLGESAPRKILQNLGGLNGFDFGPDGYLYGPLWFKGEVVRIDVDTGEMETILGGFKVPAAVNFDAAGNLWVLDSAQGHIVKVDVNERTRVVYSGFPTAMDNLAFDSKDQLWFTVMAENAIYRFDAETGKAHVLRQDAFAVPCALRIFQDGDRELLYVADIFSLKTVDLATKEITNIARNVESDIQYPSGMYVDEEKIVLTSWFSQTVQVLDRKTGAVKDTYTGVKSVYDILQFGENEIGVLNYDGRILRVAGYDQRGWPVIGKGPKGSVGMVSPGGDLLYVSSSVTNAIFVVDLKRDTLRMFIGGVMKPEGLALTDNGEIVVAETGADRVTMFDLTSGERTVLATDIPMDMKMPGYLSKVGPFNGVAIASDGSIYVTADAAGTIYKLTPVE